MTTGAAVWWALVAVEATALALAVRLATNRPAGNKPDRWQQTGPKPIRPLTVRLTWGSVLRRWPLIFVQFLHVLLVRAGVKRAPPRVATAAAGANLPSRRGSVARGVSFGNAGTETAIKAGVSAHGGSVTTAPLVALLFVALVNELTIEAIRLHLAPVPRPFHGLHLALYHVSNGLVLGWPAALAASSWRVFHAPRFDTTTKRLRRPPPAGLLIGGAWLGWWLALVVAYPLPRASTARVLHAFEVGCVVAALAPIPLAWRRPWGVPHVGVGLLVCVEVAIAMIGPWVRDVFRDWPVATAGYLTGFSALTVYLGAVALRGRRGTDAARAR